MATTIFMRLSFARRAGRSLPSGAGSVDPTLSVLRSTVRSTLREGVGLLGMLVQVEAGVLRLLVAPQPARNHLVEHVRDRERHDERIDECGKHRDQLVAEQP